MTKLRILSDLHIEFGPAYFDDAGEDIVILAGDTHARPYDAQYLFPGKQIIKIDGNHEFYSGELAVADSINNFTVSGGGLKFACCTLWTDFDLFGSRESSMAEAKRAMSDFRRIKYSKLPYTKFTPEHARVEHLKSIAFLRANPADVVVTHHAPSLESVPSYYKTDPITPAFASALEALILELSPKLWVHGHVHVSNNYWIGKTQVVSNPRGYVGRETNRNFDPYLTLEV